jgi:hypothetical protein
MIIIYDVTHDLAYGLSTSKPLPPPCPSPPKKKIRVGKLNMKVSDSSLPEMQNKQNAGQNYISEIPYFKIFWRKDASGSLCNLSSPSPHLFSCKTFCLS